MIYYMVELKSRCYQVLDSVSIKKLATVAFTALVSTGYVVAGAVTSAGGASVQDFQCEMPADFDSNSQDSLDNQINENKKLLDSLSDNGGQDVEYTKLGC